MDKIEQAIEKARQQRQGKIGETVGYEAASTPIADFTGIDELTSSGMGPLDEEPIARHDQTPSSGQVESSPPLDELPEVPELLTENRAESSLEDLVYSQTQTVTAEEDSLYKNRVIAGINRDQRIEVYRQLRTKVRQILNKNQWNTLAITSPGENAGKTLTAINLAIALSREVSHSVLLVDLDLREPSVHETLNLDVKYGLVDVLAGDAELEDVLVNPGFQRLVVLPGRALGHYSSELLSSPAMKKLVEDIRSRYASRVIIFDLPPLLRNDDALLFTPTIDSTMLVIEEGVTTADELQQCEQLLNGTNLIGTVLNKARGVS